MSINDDGIDGYQNEYSIGFEFSYNIFRGGGDAAYLRSTLANKKALYANTKHAQNLLVQQVKNSWDQLAMFKEQSELLEKQAQVVKQFLVLAKREHRMGTRSLLEVLSGEINYINALSSSVTAREDTKIAAFNLLFSMGSIDSSLLN